MKETLKKISPRIFYSKGKVILEPKNKDDWNKLADKKDCELLWFSLDVVSETGKLDGWLACYGVGGISHISVRAKDPEEAIIKLIKKVTTKEE